LVPAGAHLFEVPNKVRARDGDGCGQRPVHGRPFHSPGTKISNLVANSSATRLPAPQVISIEERPVLRSAMKWQMRVLGAIDHYSLCSS